MVIGKKLLVISTEQNKSSHSLGVQVIFGVIDSHGISHIAKSKLKMFTY